MVESRDGRCAGCDMVVRIIDKRCRLLGLYGEKAHQPHFSLFADDAGNTGQATDAHVVEPNDSSRSSSDEDLAGHIDGKQNHLLPASTCCASTAATK